jgi:hypothetical protein
MLPLYVDFGAKVCEWTLMTAWRTRLTNLPAQMDEVDVVGVLFVIGDGVVQDVMSLLGVGGIDDAEAR